MRLGLITADFVESGTTEVIFGWAPFTEAKAKAIALTAKPPKGYTNGVLVQTDGPCRPLDWDEKSTPPPLKPKAERIAEAKAAEAAEAAEASKAMKHKATK